MQHLISPKERKRPEEGVSARPCLAESGKRGDKRKRAMNEKQAGGFTLTRRGDPGRGAGSGPTGSEGGPDGLAQLPAALCRPGRVTSDFRQNGPRSTQPMPPSQRLP